MGGVVVLAVGSVNAIRKLDSTRASYSSTPSTTGRGFTRATGLRSRLLGTRLVVRTWGTAWT